MLFRNESIQAWKVEIDQKNTGLGVVRNKHGILGHETLNPALYQE